MQDDKLSGKLFFPMLCVYKSQHILMEVVKIQSTIILVSTTTVVSFETTL